MPELPPPLPPAERTVGQLIGETIRADGASFWRALPLGIPVALADELSGQKVSGLHAVLLQLAIYYGLAPVFSAAYVWACALVLRVRPDPGAFWLALVIYLPFPLLRAIYTLPAVAWFAFVGLAVPAALVEHEGFRAAFARGRELGSADYVHALGSLAALVLVVAVGEVTLAALLHTMADASTRVATALSDVVVSPLLFLGGAMLYTDQAARAAARTPLEAGAPASGGPT